MSDIAEETTHDPKPCSSTPTRPLARSTRRRCSGASDCKLVYKGYSELCRSPPVVLKTRDGGTALDGDPKDEDAACRIIAEAAAAVGPQ